MKRLFLKHIALISCAVILFPVGVTFSHSLEQHEHKTCDDPTASHFHEESLDCSLYKFQLNPVTSFETITHNSNVVIIPQDNNFSTYNFTVWKISLDTSNRGPPQLS